MSALFVPGVLMRGITGCIGSVYDFRVGAVHLHHVIAEIGAADAEEHVICDLRYYVSHSGIALFIVGP